MADRSVASARLSKLGRYEVLNELGKGAMGVVYLAKDPVIGRMVAIKTIRLSTVSDDDSESREFRERFVREAQTAGILSHSNIVTIHDIGEDGDTQTSFIAMEYIEGKNLKTLMAEKTRFTYDQIAEMIGDVAEALDYAHRKGIIHRDVKPANIIITTDGKVKITDFGIAKIASSNLTTTGQFLGTPNYMSPEQVSGAPVDGRSDIFSLGVVLYELLTNRKPFQGENLTAISYKIVHEDFTPPAALSAAVPPEFNPIVARAMAKDPWNRYQRGKDFALALHQLRAHLEEQRALQDLGTLVSAAENLPTMKIANLEHLLADGEEPPAGAEVRPPADIRTHSDSSSAARRRAEVPTTPVPVEAALTPVSSVGSQAAAPLGEADVSTNRFRTPLMEIAADGAPAPEGEQAGEPEVDDAAETSWGPAYGGASALEAHAASGDAPQAGSADWRRLSKREVNPRWFWSVAAGMGGLVLLLAIILLVRASVASRPTVEANAALETQTRERRLDLEQGKKLLNEGKYQESLALFRKVLSRSPNNQQARLYAQMAENALAGRAEEVKRQAEAENRLQLARDAFAGGNFAEAKRLADEVLALDGGRVEAQTLREDAATKLAAAETEAAAAAALKKKIAKARPQVARKEGPVLPDARPSPASAASSPSSSVAASTATLRLLFDSPVSEGHIMVAVNNAILLRKPFSFKKKAGLFKTIENTGVVSATIPVNPGSAAVKAWLSGPDIRGGVLAEGSANLSPGESRTLRLQYSGGNLSMRIQ